MTPFLSQVRFLVDLPAYLRRTLTFDDAHAIIERRLAERDQRFLDLVRRAVFDDPASPYLPLFRAAGCEYGDLGIELARSGLQGLLRQLRDAGVWIAFDEYKGRRPIVRSGVTHEVDASSFDNHLLSGGLAAVTGGSSGRSSRSFHDYDFLTERAAYDHLMFRLLDLDNVPYALWYPKLPASIGLVQCLKYAKIGHPPAAWFDMAIGGRVVPYWHRLGLAALIGASRVSPAPFPWPKTTPLTEAARIASWLGQQLAERGRVALQSTVSGVLRVAQAAVEGEVSLAGVQFVVGSEPLTEARRALIESSGARVYERYNTMDVGNIGIGCGAPASAGDLHLCSDAIVLLQDDAPDDPGAPRPFYLTSLIAAGPKLLINVQLGDTGTLSERRCGCLFDQVGFHTHVTSVRSETRSTAEGLTVPYADLTRIAERVLPGRFGGSALDYQWIEESGDLGLTRLRLVVHPRINADAESIRQAALDILGSSDAAHRFFARMLDRAGTVRVVREHPFVGANGKTPALVRRSAP